MTNRRLTVLGAAAVLAAAFVLYIFRHSELHKDVRNQESESSEEFPQPVLAQDGSVSRPNASAAVPSPSAKSPAKQDVGWIRSFGDSRDYYAFVSSAAEAALKGDGRAAYYVREALRRCAPVQALYERKAREPNFDPEFEFINKENTLIFPPVQTREDRVAQFGRCTRLATGNAFAGLPVSDEHAHSPEFWDKLSLSLNDSLAKADRAATERANLAKLAGTERTEALERIHKDTQQALSSRDPQALFSVGLSSQDFRDLVDPKQGGSKRLGLALAACDLGADCQYSHLGFQMWRGNENVSDISNLTFADAMREMVGNDRFISAYNDAQVFKQLWSLEDWEGIEKALQADDGQLR